MSIYICPLCQEEMELEEAGRHLMSDHMDTMLVMLVMYSDENDFSYETLSYLCDTIGYHKIGIEDINRVACSYIQTDKKEEVCPICLEPFNNGAEEETLCKSGTAAEETETLCKSGTVEELGSSGAVETLCKSGTAAGETLCKSRTVEPEPPRTIMELKKCKHLFCSPCLTLWLKEHTTCPLCKDDLKEIA